MVRSVVFFAGPSRDYPACTPVRFPGSPDREFLVVAAGLPGQQSLKVAEVFSTSETAGTGAVFADPRLAEPDSTAEVPPAVGLAETAVPAGVSCVLDSTMPKPTTSIRTAAKVRSLPIPLMDSPSAESYVR